LHFSDRRTNARFVATDKRFAYFEKVHITGGHDIAGHNWHWSWRQHNWIP